MPAFSWGGRVWNFGLISADGAYVTSPPKILEHGTAQLSLPGRWHFMRVVTTHLEGGGHPL